MKGLADKAIKGRILYVSGDQLMVSRRIKLLESLDGGNHWEESLIFKNHGILDELKMKSHYLSRLFRFGVHHITQGDTNSWGIIFNKKLGTIENGKMKQLSDLPHSRPLSFEYYKNGFLFGEYRNNPERSPVGLYSFSNEGELRSALQFYNIRHIHGVYKDPYSDFLWITTGDTDEEAAIYRCSSNFEFLEKVLSGSQQTRTIKLLFDKDYIFFGSDAPEEVNHIYKMDRLFGAVKQLQQVGSSVFHGCKVGKWLFFSTAIEPSTINKTKYAEIWASPNGEEWKCIFKFKKDILPMKFFQYGQVFFPTISGNTDALWLSPYATQYSNQSFKISISKIEDLFYKS